MNATASDMLLETLIARTIGEESAVAMAAIAAAPIPGGIKRYLRAEIFNRLADDLAHAPHFARVASPSAGPDTIRDALLAHATEQYLFPREEFLFMLDNATRFTENYLCRPRWTLSSFLFLDQPAITTEMLLRKLEYIADYAYLPQLLRRMVTQSGKQALSSSDCIAYINRIDDAVVREHSPRERALLTSPIFQFYHLSAEIAGMPVALRPLVLFLEDKHLTDLREYLESACQVREASQISLEEFIAINEDFSAGRPAVPSPPESPHPLEIQDTLTITDIPPSPRESVELSAQSLEVTEPLCESAEPVVQGPDTTPLPEAITEPTIQGPERTPSPAELFEPLQETPDASSLAAELAQPLAQSQDVASPHEEPVAPIPQSSEPTEPEPPHEQTESAIVTESPGEQAQSPEMPEPAREQGLPPDVPEPLIQESVNTRTQESTSPGPDAPESSPVVPVQPPVPEANVPSLQEMIPGALRRRFINVICGKDTEFYDLVIARLNEMDSWPQASAYIRELFEINSIDPFHDAAVAFTDIVQKRCNQARTPHP